MFGSIAPLSVDAIIAQTAAKPTDAWYDLEPAPVSRPRPFRQFGFYNYNDIFIMISIIMIAPVSRPRPFRQFGFSVGPWVHAHTTTRMFLVNFAGF